MNGIRLGNLIEVYVPSTIDVDTVGDTSEWRDIITAHLAEWYGGATILKGAGAWLSEDKGIVSEEVTLVRANCSDEALAEHDGALELLLLEMKAGLHQEAVAVGINNSLYLL